MKKKLNLKHLIPVIILLLLLSGCNTGTSPNITSSTPATSEKTPESSDISSVNNSSETPGSDISTASTESSSLNPVSSAPQTNSNPATSPETSSSTASSTSPSSNVSTSDTQTSIDLEELVTPMIYTDTMQGSAVDFVEKTIDISIANDNWTSHIAIIRSYDELKSVYEGEKETFPKDLYIYVERDDYSKMYTEEFFEDKAVVMLFVHRGLEVKTYSIDSVTKNDNRLYIHMDNVILDDDKQYIQVSADYRTFISVSKEDMSGITDIVVCEK